MRNGKSKRQSRTAKGIQHRIDAGCRQRQTDRIALREIRQAVAR
jgi:hypothetical protein